MGLENVKYDAFISYRHSELDKATAMAIQKKLENFKLPKSLVGKTPSGKDKIERVFRDQDELPLASNLSDPIEDALRNSEYLIVICTPRLPESAWCAKEIETFMALHGRERIFAVLAEGEPNESFPDLLRFERRIVIEGDGSQHEVVKEFEPLAADVRGTTPKDRKKLIDDATLRLAAPMFGLNYDDLKQRHKEQRTKKIIATSASVAAVFFVFAMVCMFLAFQISAQKDTIEGQFTEIENKNKEIEAQNKEITKQNVEITKQNEEISKKNDEITRQNSEILAKNDEITKKNQEIKEQFRREQLKYAESMADASFTLLYNGLRDDAIYAARNALPDTKDSTDIPYSGAAENALANAIGYYRKNKTYQPDAAFYVNNLIYTMNVSPDTKYLVVIDHSETLRIYDTDTKKELDNFPFSPNNYANSSILFVSDDTFVVSDYSHTYRYCITNSEKTVISDNSAFSYAGSLSEKKYVLYNDGYLSFYSAQDHTLLNTIDLYEFTGGQYYMPAILNSTVDYTGKFITLSFDTSLSGYQAVISVSLDDMQPIIAYLCEGDVSNGYLIGNTLYTISYYNERFLADMDTQACAINITTGETLWMADIPICRLDNMTYSQSANCLLLHSDRYYCYINTTSDVHNLIVAQFPEPVLDYYSSDTTVSFISEKGSLYMYMFENNLLTDYTTTWFTPKSENYISNVVYRAGKIYAAYSGEDYIAHFLFTINPNYIEYGSISTYSSDNVSSDGTKSLSVSLKENKNTFTLTDTITQKVLCKVSDKNDDTVFFVDDGSKYWGTYRKELHLYDTEGNLINTLAEPDDYSYIYGISDHGKYAIYMQHLYNGSTSYRLVFTETGEEAAVISGEHLSDNRVVFSDSSDCYATLDSQNNCINMYRYNSSEPYASKDINIASVYDFDFSSDGRFISILYANHTVEFYSTDSFELISTLYQKINYINSFDYIASINSYMIRYNSMFTYLINTDFEVTAELYECIGFNQQTNQFIMCNSSTLYKCDYLTYDKLIEIADKRIRGYEPSEKLKKKYHI